MHALARLHACLLACPGARLPVGLPVRSCPPIVGRSTRLHLASVTFRWRNRGVLAAARKFVLVPRPSVVAPLHFVRGHARGSCATTALRLRVCLQQGCAPW